MPHHQEITPYTCERMSQRPLLRTHTCEASQALVKQKSAAFESEYIFLVGGQLVEQRLATQSICTFKANLALQPSLLSIGHMTSLSVV